MVLRFVFLVAVAVAAVAIFHGMLLQEPPLPQLDPDPWWSDGPRTENIAITPFEVTIPQKDVDELYMRLKMEQYLTPPLENANFTYGMSSITLKRIHEYWTTKYNWKQREVLLNAYPHYKTQVEGLNIHFLHAKPESSKDVQVLPLLLIHGWPGSFTEFYGILPHLTKAHPGSNIAFEVICPSLPGYGFSQSSAKIGLGFIETAQIFLKLMKRLGHEKFYIQGGDFGSIIATSMATIYENNVMGVHLNMFTGNPTLTNLLMPLGAVLPTGWLISEQDYKKLYPLMNLMQELMRESGYLHIQATKPDTIGVALNNSPLGLAAYILEKFSTWTKKKNINLPDGGLNKDFPIAMDKLLDNVCIYWFTHTIQTSVRFYAESFSKRNMEYKIDSIPCRVPAGLICYPDEILPLPRLYAATKYYDIVTYTDMEEGGHFAAMEQPEEMARDIFRFITKVEERKVEQIMSKIKHGDQ